MSSKNPGDCHPHILLNGLKSVGGKTNLAIQKIVGVCPTDGLLIKTTKKKSVLNDCLLVYMWNIILWGQLTEPNRYSALQRNQHLAGGRACFLRIHRSRLKFHTVLLPNSYTQWTCVRGILLNVNHWYIMSTREKHKVKQENLSSINFKASLQVPVKIWSFLVAREKQLFV